MSETLEITTQVTIPPHTLAELETVIKAGLTSIKTHKMEVGVALRELQRSRLYRAEYKTFGQYCQTVLGISRSTAYDYMKAAGVGRALQNEGKKPPRSIREALEYERANTPRPERVVKASLTSAKAIQKTQSIAATPVNQSYLDRSEKAEIVSLMREIVEKGTKAKLGSEHESDKMSTPLSQHVNEARAMLLSFINEREERLNIQKSSLVN